MSATPPPQEKNDNVGFACDAADLKNKKHWSLETSCKG